MSLGIDNETPLDARLMIAVSEAIVFTLWRLHSNCAINGSSMIWLFLGALYFSNLEASRVADRARVALNELVSDECSRVGAGFGDFCSSY